MNAEISTSTWDIICFSERRAFSEKISLEGGHVLYLNLSNTSSAGVGILIHKRLASFVRREHYISDRILCMDLKIDARMYSVFAVYVPHAGYPKETLDCFYEQLF